MRIILLLVTWVLLASCGKSEPPAQSVTPPASPAPASEPASTPPAAAMSAPAEETTPVTAMEPAADAAPATDAVSGPSWSPADAPGGDYTAPDETEPADSPSPAVESAAAPAPTPAPTPETPAATTTPEAATAVAPTSAAAGDDKPYKVVDGHIDADTVEGWKIYRGIGTCATCHGPVGQGGVGPALVESLKEKITKELFVETVTNGRDGTMMKPFGENPVVMQNIDRIYAYLKARSDGVLGPENLLKYPLGKAE